MGPFKFTLERVLGWRRTQLDLEETLFKQQVLAMSALDRERAEIEAAGIMAELQVRDGGSVAGWGLAALGNFRLHVKRKEAEIETRRMKCRQSLAEREKAMMEARRRFRLLERLKERRQAEWQAASDRELEELASESYEARWNRRRA